jgi:hypothetical protein
MQASTALAIIIILDVVPDGAATKQDRKLHRAKSSEKKLLPRSKDDRFLFFSGG